MAAEKLSPGRVATEQRSHLHRSANLPLAAIDSSAAPTGPFGGSNSVSGRVGFDQALMPSFGSERSIMPGRLPRGLLIYFLELFVPGCVKITKALVLVKTHTGYENAIQAE